MIPEADGVRRYVHRVRVRAEDLDELGHVNNVTYLRYAEEAARRHAASRGFALADFRAAGILPVVRKHAIHYLRPALPSDALTVLTEVVRLQGARAVRRTEIRREVDGELLAQAETEWVWVDPERGRPRSAPAAVREAFGFGD